MFADRVAHVARELSKSEQVISFMCFREHEGKERESEYLGRNFRASQKQN